VHRFRDYYINCLKYEHWQNVQRLTDLCRTLYNNISQFKEITVFEMCWELWPKTFDVTRVLVKFSIGIFKIKEPGLCGSITLTCLCDGCALEKCDWHVHIVCVCVHTYLCMYPFCWRQAYEAFTHSNMNEVFDDVLQMLHTGFCIVCHWYQCVAISKHLVLGNNFQEILNSGSGV
jgi:hypothetical protein